MPTYPFFLLFTHEETPRPFIQNRPALPSWKLQTPVGNRPSTVPRVVHAGQIRASFLRAPALSTLSHVKAWSSLPKRPKHARPALAEKPKNRRAPKQSSSPNLAVCLHILLRHCKEHFYTVTLSRNNRSSMPFTLNTHTEQDPANHPQRNNNGQKEYDDPTITKTQIPMHTRTESKRYSAQSTYNAC